MSDLREFSHLIPKKAVIKWDRVALSIIKAQFTSGNTYPMACMFIGESGMGKSHFIRQYHAKESIPLTECNGHCRMSVPELLGHAVLREGSTSFFEGPLLTAYRFGLSFLLNEVDLVPPDMLAGLNTILDRAPLTVPQTGETVYCHSNFRFFTTANSNGNGENSRNYGGTLMMNRAFLDRFIIVKMDYLSPSNEKALLSKKFPSISSEDIERLVSIADDLRSCAKGEASQVSSLPLDDLVVTTRSLEESCALMQYASLSLRDSLQYSIINKLSSETAIAVSEYVQRVLG